MGGRAGAFAWLLGLLAGCASGPRPPEYPPGLPAAEAARIVVSRLAPVEAFSAEIDVTFRREGGARSASGALVVARPDRIRLRCWGPFGATVLDLLVVDRIADLSLPREGRRLELDLDRPGDDVADLEPEVRALLLLDAVLDDLNADRATWRLAPAPSDDLGAIEFLGDGAPTARLVYDRATLLPVRRESLGGDPLTVTWDDYRPADGIWWPREIEIESREFRLTVEIDDLTINPELDPRTFAPRPGDDE